jgi:uncharacterized linocin/CFP29 family protein
MNHLHRELAPITAAGWQEIEKEAKRTLKSLLAARRIVDYHGPLGWAVSQAELGRSEEIEGPRLPRANGEVTEAHAVQARLRKVQPLVELRVPFEMSRRELDAVDRGARDPDVGTVTAAARRVAIAEDRAVFHGYASAGITGICEAQAGAAVPLGGRHSDYPNAVATALTKLRDDGVEGPFAVALSEQLYRDLSARTEGGYPMLIHVQRLIEGPVVWAPGLDGGVVISQRGGDFELTVGQDFSIGYLDHTAETVRLYIEESFTFLILSSQAARPLKA